MPRSTEEDILWAQSGTRPINIVRWSPYEIIPEPFGGGRVTSSKAKGEKLMGIWKRWYERRGWKVYGNTSTGFRAYSPKDAPYDVHACVLHRHDPKTLARLET